MGTWKTRGLRGSALEEYINYSNEKYRESGLALIQKIPTPITPIDIDKASRHITLAYFEKKSTVDYIGVVQGIPVCFDAKECASTSFSLANVHEHQFKFMEEFEKQGGIAFLIIFFKSLDKSRRMKVKYFSCDMNKTFIDMAKVYFPNAKIVIDRYHFIRQVYWALENVRKRIQKNMAAPLRKYYKRSKSLITKRKSKIPDDSKSALELMLEYSEDLRKAHFIKELFVDMLEENSYSKQRQLLREWLLEVESSGIKEFKAAITAFRNNYSYILNALKSKLSANYNKS